MFAAYPMESPAVHVVKMHAEQLGVLYGDTPAVRDVTIDIYQNQVLVLIGPRGCGKGSFLRTLNRMNETIGARITGKVLLDGRDIYASDVDPVTVRRQVGMVLQKSNPFPKSVFEKVAYGLRVAGIKDMGTLRDRVERALRQAEIWDEGV